MTKIIGLTGSIGMGKSTTARQLRELGVEVSDADAITHRLLAEDEAVIAAIAERFPPAVEGGKVNRKALGKIVFADSAALNWLEQLLHPKVRAENIRLIEQARARDLPLWVLDIPLLYETGAEGLCDEIMVVSAPYEVQRQRVLARSGMTEEIFQAILNKQLPDAEKRARADVVIDTSGGLEHSRTQIQHYLSSIRG